MTDTGIPKPRLNRKVVLIGGGIAAAVVYYVYEKRKSAGVSATVPATTDPTIDPNTGIPYAEESGLDYMTSGSPYSQLSSSSPFGLANYSTAASIPATNQSYAKNINDYLVNSLGYSQTLVSSALGKWLSGAGTPLTQQESAVVQAAQAYGGTPPTGVPSPNYVANQGQSGYNLNIPFVTGDINQDTAIANSQYVSGAYQAYLKNIGSAQAQTAYENAVNQYHDQNPVPAPTA